MVCSLDAPPNFFTPEFGLVQFDPPPFELQLTPSIIPVPMMGVLIQAKPAEKTGGAAGATGLQLNLLSDENC